MSERKGAEVVEEDNLMFYFTQNDNVFESSSLRNSHCDSLMCEASDFVVEVSSSASETLSLQSKSSRGGGITSCVPHCRINSKKNPDLSFYVIPKDATNGYV